jgi:hypothetical protein
MSDFSAVMTMSILEALRSCVFFDGQDALRGTEAIGFVDLGVSKAIVFWSG